jgi:hypothetical protein
MIVILSILGIGVMWWYIYANSRTFFPPLSRKYAGHSLEAEIHNTRTAMVAYYKNYGIVICLYNEVIRLFIRHTLALFLQLVQRY